MKRTIKLFKEHGLLRVIDDEVDIDLEVAHIAYIETKKDDSKALLFTNVVSKRLNKKFSMPVLMNTFCSYEATNLLFGKDPDTVASQIEELLHLKPPVGFYGKIEMFSKLFGLRKIFPKRESEKGECQEVEFKGENIDLFDIPVLKTWSEDGGAFITMGQVYTRSLDGKKQNLGMYRLQVYDKNRLGMHWQIHKDGAHFFHEYKKAGKKMPVSIAIGGSPLYIWCGQAPMPNGMFELLLYGLIKEENPRLVKSLTNDIYIPKDVDIVIEGFVDPLKSEIEGPFGDHTGYYTLKESYPVMDVTCITHKKEPVYQATVVGKPPLEDKYMGWATERIFLPLLKTTAPDLIDYKMPENGVFHNLILAKMKTMYPGHAKQFMHAFWGAGQMSFVKHAIFVDEKAPSLDNYESFSAYVLNRFTPKSMFITEGILDALDHSSNETLVGGKLGIDATAAIVVEAPNLLGDAELLQKVQELVPDAVSLHQYMRRTNNPVTVITLNKTKNTREYFDALIALSTNIRIVVFVDAEANDVLNPYMLIWRVTNNMDALRDIFTSGLMVGIDGTNKSSIDGFSREWPDDVVCTKSVVEALEQKSLWDLEENLHKKYQL